MSLLLGALLPGRSAVSGCSSTGGICRLHGALCCLALCPSVLLPLASTPVASSAAYLTQVEADWQAIREADLQPPCAAAGARQ